ncbi:MAG: PIN domain nuclease [Micrococcales bacterium]|nr:PIN domain nuclease [Micrococcales bacterium]
MTYLVDTSAWVEFLRGTGTSAAVRVRELIATHRDDLRLCGPVSMELRAGTTRPADVARIDALIDSIEPLDFDPLVDFYEAARVQRSARASGRCVRSLVDCQIAAVALRHDATVVHQDVDFELIADLTGLRHESWRLPA